MSLHYAFFRFVCLLAMTITGPGLGCLSWWILGETDWVQSSEIRFAVSFFVFLFFNGLSVIGGLISYQLHEIIKMNRVNGAPS